jgi:PIN domain nuclease of toxin-antitoxin system
MNLLLDTHTLLWSLIDDPKLSQTIRKVIGENVVYVSAASIWEIRIKQHLGKLDEAPGNFFDIIKKLPIILLSITADHAHAVGDLPLYHRDPFDRILIAQALLEDLILVTRDEIIQKYEVPFLSY